MKQGLKAAKEVVRKIPIVGPLSRKVYAAVKFRGSEHFWIKHYARGRNSGPGSYNKLATFKAEVLNTFVREHNISSVIEFGCGDGNQLRLAEYKRYTGFDISPTAIGLCREIFRADRSKSFKLMKDYAGETAELALSLDVVYHLIEDEVYESYMRRLFAAASRYVIIYSSNKDEQSERQALHVKHRKFTTWVERQIDGWHLMRHIPNTYPYPADKEGSFADFYIYRRVD